MRIINTGSGEEVFGAAKEWVYNGLDCCVTLEVLNAITPQLDNTTSATYNFSRELQAPVLEMSMRGLLVDQRKRHEVLSLYREQIERLSEQLDVLVREGVGTSANWRSHAQLKTLLYDVMGLPVQRKRSTTGKFTPTVDRDALEKLVNQYIIAEPIINHLLLLRDIDKKRQFLETGIDPDGRMRTNFNIAGTNTGRLASAMSDFGTGTNMQNVDRELRSVFVADPGYVFVNIDLEQADARNVGAICWNLFVEKEGENYAGAYLNACESGDLHTTVCRMAWPELDWPADASGWRRVADRLAYRGDSYRQLAKKLGHGTNFYGTPPTMAKHTKVERSQIEEFQRAYFAAFPAIGTYDPKKNDPRHTRPTWHNAVRRALSDSSTITTLLGRRRVFFGRPNDDETLRGAIAYEPQSLTADEIDRGILRLWRGHRVQLLVQVHDNILFQCREEEVGEVVPWAMEQVRTVIPLKRDREFCVPTEAKVGWNWGDFDPKKNVDGLDKWKGSESRKRSEQPTRLSINYL